MRAYLKQVIDNTTQLNVEEKTELLSLLIDYEYVFDGNLWNWDTEPVELELKTDYKLFNRKYYPVPIINKENFRTELEHLVEIGVLTTVQQRQYGTH